MTLAPELVAAPALPEAFEVAVTAEDILLGQCGHGDNCPIARAVRRYFYLRDIRLGVEGVCIRLLQPSIVGPFEYRHDGHRFITAFDRGEPVGPCVVHFTRQHNTEESGPA